MLDIKKYQEVMKKLIPLFVMIALTARVFTQSPEKMSYQALIRNESGELVKNSAVGMKISILQGSASGVAVYIETHETTTNANGLVTLEIGGGTIITGTFTGIDWSAGTYFIKTETDPSGGTIYSITGTSQVLSVPYALYANTAGTAKDAATRAYVDQKLKLLTAALQGVQDADGNHYPTVMIGDQVWMAENLKTTKYNDGTTIPLVTDQTAWSNLVTPGYCWYNNDAANKNIYGAMYNGYAVLTNNLCPAGWHVPSIVEFQTLKNYLIANGYNFDGTTTINKIAKSMAATTRWTVSTYTGSPGNNPAANNSCGFSGLPGGLRAYSGIFYYISNEAYWWTSSIPSTYGSIYSLNYGSYSVSEPTGPVKSGLSVRCLKDN
jgi:uncharacterized protein (TIGR02145 family)